MADQSQRRVLVVEDDPDIRESLRVALEKKGYPVATAENGQQALDMLEDGAPPCVILLDMMMPVMDGWKFLTALDEREVLSSVPVVVVSSLDAGDAATRVREVFHKPVDVRALMDAVCEHCGRPGEA